MSGVLYILAEQSKSELNESTSTVAMASEVWRKFKVDNNKVERWSVNLRTVIIFCIPN
jgi:hypothetical protein